MLRIGVLSTKNGGRRPPVPSPFQGERAHRVRGGNRPSTTAADHDPLSFHWNVILAGRLSAPAAAGGGLPSMRSCNSLSAATSPAMDLSTRVRATSSNFLVAVPSYPSGRGRLADEVRL